MKRGRSSIRLLKETRETQRGSLIFLRPNLPSPPRTFFDTVALPHKTTDNADILAFSPEPTSG